MKGLGEGRETNRCELITITLKQDSSNILSLLFAAVKRWEEGRGVALFLTGKESCALEKAQGNLKIIYDVYFVMLKAVCYSTLPHYKGT